MKEIKNNSRLTRILVYSGVALCAVAALMYLYKAYIMLF